MMGAWYIRPLPGSGWQVLTPCRTQAAAIVETRDEAFAAASMMVSDEGGGELVTLGEHGEECRTDTILPRALPYRAGYPVERGYPIQPTTDPYADTADPVVG